MGLWFSGDSDIIQRRQWHPTPVLLPGKSHGRRSLVGCSPWGRTRLTRLSSSSSRRPARGTARRRSGRRTPHLHLALLAGPGPPASPAPHISTCRPRWLRSCPMPRKFRTEEGALARGLAFGGGTWTTAEAVLDLCAATSTLLGLRDPGDRHSVQMVRALRLQILRALPRDPHQRHRPSFPSRLSGRASSILWLPRESPRLPWS